MPQWNHDAALTNQIAGNNLGKGTGKTYEVYRFNSNKIRTNRHHRKLEQCNQGDYFVIFAEATANNDAENGYRRSSNCITYLVSSESVIS